MCVNFTKVLNLSRDNLVMYWEIWSFHGDEDSSCLLGCEAALWCCRIHITTLRTTTKIQWYTVWTCSAT